MFITTVAIAQKDIKTDTFLVEGNCNMCKQRIEEAAYIKGVKYAVWNKDQQQLTVTYRSSKTTSEDILKHVAGAGHRTEKYMPDDSAYKKLPDCCQYKTNLEKH